MQKETPNFNSTPSANPKTPNAEQKNLSSSPKGRKQAAYDSLSGLSGGLHTQQALTQAAIQGGERWVTLDT
jgi:hypothetical protein